MSNPYNQNNSRTETRTQQNSNNNGGSSRPKIVIVSEGAEQRSQGSIGSKKDK